MEALVRELEKFFAVEFKARIVDMQVHCNSGSSPEFMMGGGSLSMQTGHPETRMTLYLVENHSKHSEYPGHAIHSSCRDIFEDMQDCAHLVRMSYSVEFPASFRTTLEFILTDEDKMIEHLKNGTYRKYSKEFDKLMDDELKKT